MATGTIDRLGERVKLGENVPVTYLHVGNCYNTDGKDSKVETGVIIRGGAVVSVYIGGTVLDAEDFLVFARQVQARQARLDIGCGI